MDLAEPEWADPVVAETMAPEWAARPPVAEAPVAVDPVDRLPAEIPADLLPKTRVVSPSRSPFSSLSKVVPVGPVDEAEWKR